MNKVLLLGGSQHLCMVPVESNFGTPISHCSRVELPERYHRAVFYPLAVGATVANAWYVYVTDAYQSQPGQLTEAALVDELNKREIAPHMASIDVKYLQREYRLSAA